MLHNKHNAHTPTIKLFMHVNMDRSNKANAKNKKIHIL